jgi:hypothetical protein
LVVAGSVVSGIARVVAVLLLVLAATAAASTKHLVKKAAELRGGESYQGQNENEKTHDAKSPNSENKQIRYGQC